MATRQASFDDLGTPLEDVTFCVVDLETTGGSPNDHLITEIGAVKLKGGRREGTFHTLVNPGRAIPPTITVLTGITDSMVVRAPRIETVLGTLVDFIGTDSVIVGHNIRFDVGFLNAALERDERPKLTHPTVDTVGLARRLLRDEVPNCKLGTLAEHLQLPNRPTHRALDDALATGDLLHFLIERAGTLGVTGLDDLRILPTLSGSEYVAKLRLTEHLPRSPGVYLFRDQRGQVLYVGKATNLRSRVRQYFSSDPRRKIGNLLRETGRIDHKRCDTEFEAAVLEIRLIHHLEPRYNRQGKRWQKAVYLKLTLGERYPRLSIVKVHRDDGALYVGPLPSKRFATSVMEAVQTVVPLRRCTSRPGRGKRSGACLPAQLGVALCPCVGDVDAERYDAAVRLAADGLSANPERLIEPLRERMLELAGDERFEEAGLTRDRLSALCEALRRTARFNSLRAVDRLVVRQANGHGLEIRRGRLTHMWSPPDSDTGRLDGLETVSRVVEATPSDPGPPELGPLPSDLADELLVVSRWLDRNAHRLDLSHTRGEWASPLPHLPSFESA
jgi:DNA polymerase-3 subunit epsilon